MARKRNRKSKVNRNSIRGSGLVGLILGVVALISIAAFIFMRSTIESTNIDEKTLCDTSKKIDSVVAILIDTTDQLSKSSVRHAERYIDLLVSNLPSNAAIAVYEITDNAGGLIEPVISICKPDDGSKANTMVSSPEIIRKNFLKRFNLPLRSKLEIVMNNKDSSTTPLIESIQSAVVETFLQHKNATSKQIIVISDLLQHSSLYSFYREVPNFNNFAGKSREIGKGFMNLQGIQMHFLVVPSKVPVGSRNDLIRFWRDFMIENNAAPGSTMEPLS